MFLRGLLKRVLLIPLGIFVLALVLTVYLGTQVDAAWWLLLFLLVPSVIVVGGLALAAWVITGILSPRKLSLTEARSVRDFTGKVMQVAETARTPLPLLGAQLAKDIVIHRDPRLVRQLIAESASLKSDYQKLRETVSVQSQLRDN